MGRCMMSMCLQGLCPASCLGESMDTMDMEDNNSVAFN